MGSINERQEYSMSEESSCDLSDEDSDEEEVATNRYLKKKKTASPQASDPTYGTRQSL